jgi:hypothetical protein
METITIVGSRSGWIRRVINVAPIPSNKLAHFRDSNDESEPTKKRTITTVHGSIVTNACLLSTDKCGSATREKRVAKETMSAKPAVWRSDLGRRDEVFMHKDGIPGSESVKRWMKARR